MSDTVRWLRTGWLWAGLLGVGLPGGAAAAGAQTNTFDLVLGDRPVGHSTFSLAKAKDGYKLTERAVYRVGPADGDQSDEFRLSANYGYVEGTTVDHTAQRQTSYMPDRGREEVSVVRVQGGGGRVATLVPVRPNLIVLPLMDAGAAQVALLYVLANPNEKNMYSVLIPSTGGGGGGRRGRGAASDADGGGEGAVLPPGDNAVDAVWLKGKDTSGVLDGKAMLLHTYMLAAGRLRLIFYADEGNTLMQCNAAALGASYVRAGFKLNAVPAKPAGAGTLQTRPGERGAEEKPGQTVGK